MSKKGKKKQADKDWTRRFPLWNTGGTAGNQVSEKVPFSGAGITGFIDRTFFRKKDRFDEMTDLVKEEGPEAAVGQGVVAESSLDEDRELIRKYLKEKTALVHDELIITSSSDAEEVSLQIPDPKRKPRKTELQLIREMTKLYRYREGALYGSGRGLAYDIQTNSGRTSLGSFRTNASAAFRGIPGYRSSGQAPSYADPWAPSPEQPAWKTLRDRDPTRPINAPRRLFGETREAEVQSLEVDVAVCRDLVAIGRWIASRPDLKLIIRDDIQVPCTDGIQIMLPRQHPRLRLVTKHELSHIYFKSDAELRSEFIDELLAQLSGMMKRPLGSVSQARLKEALAFIINVFEDIRVNSLWGELYPGDGEKLDDWYLNEIGPRMASRSMQADNDDIESFFTYAILVTVGQARNIKSTRWERFETQVLDVANRIRLTTFSAGLMLCKKLLLDVARELAQELEEEEPTKPLWGSGGKGNDDDAQQQQQAAQAASSLSEQLQKLRGGGGGAGGEPQQEEKDSAANDDKDNGNGSGSGKEPFDPQNFTAKNRLRQAIEKMLDGWSTEPLDDDNAGFDYDQKPPEDLLPKRARFRRRQAGLGGKHDLRAVLRALQGVDVDSDESLSDFVERQKAAALDMVDDLEDRRAALLEAERQKSKATNEKADEKTYLQSKIEDADLAYVQVPAASIIPVQLGDEDYRAARRWRALFEHVLGTTAYRLEEDGSEFVPEVYLSQMLAGEPFECYRREVPGQGFDVTLLVDMSSSMAGSRFQAVEKLAAALRKALDFSFVRLQVLGFTSVRSGVVRIFKFPKDAPGLQSTYSPVKGGTPLHVAVQVAGELLLDSLNEKHVFVLTDGAPTFSGRNQGYYSGQQLMKKVSESVERLKQHNVAVWCFMVGYYTPTDEEIDSMFGQQRWMRIQNETLYEDSFKFIRDRFLRYLQGR